MANRTQAPSVQALFKRIAEACDIRSTDYGLVSNIELEPLGGFDNNVLMPPTYASVGEPYHVEKRYFSTGGPEGKGGVQKIIVLDSIQSSANRREMSLYRAMTETKEIVLPDVLLDLPLPYGMTSVFQLPHRLSDGFLVDSTDKASNTNFQRTPYGKALFGADMDATAEVLFSHNPVSLIFGSWVSFAGLSPELSFKQKRCMQSEIIACVASFTKRTESRLAPIALDGKATVWVKVDGEGLREISDATKKPGAGWVKKNLSEVGLNNLPPGYANTSDKSGDKASRNPARVDGTSADITHKGGVSVTSPITEKCLLTFAGLRQMRGWKNDLGKATAARAYLACLGILSHVLRTENYALRSGCTLVPTNLKDGVPFQWCGHNPDSFAISHADAIALHAEALKAVKHAKIDYDETKRIELTPSKILTNSIQKALWKKSDGKNGDAEEDDTEATDGNQGDQK